MTIKNGDLPAMPLANGADGTPWTARDLGNPEQVIGLTKREYFAAMAMQGILSNGVDFTLHEDKDVAAAAVLHADLLLTELERTK